jgi:hypothetical protein
MNIQHAHQLSLAVLLSFVSVAGCKNEAPPAQTGLAPAPPISMTMAVPPAPAQVAAVPAQPTVAAATVATTTGLPIGVSSNAAGSFATSAVKGLATAAPPAMDPEKEGVVPNRREGVKEGEMCGGFAGFMCKAGLRCVMTGPKYPDQAGVCKK